MIIKADQEGQRFLSELADLALRGSGLQALQKVNQLGQLLKPLLEEDNAKDPNMEVVRPPKSRPMNIDMDEGKKSAKD
jgi:hypothetical protein